MLCPVHVPAVHGRSRFRRSVAAVAVALVLVGCSHSAPSADELTETLMVAGMNEAQARCAAEAVTENLSDADIESIMKAGPSGVPFDRVPDETKPDTDATRRVDTPEVTAARQALGECRSLEDPVGET